MLLNIGREFKLVSILFSLINKNLAYILIKDNSENIS